MVSHLASPWNRGLGQIGNGQLGKLYLPEMKECRLRGSPATNLMNAHFQQTLWTSLLFQGVNAIAKLQLNSYMFKWRWRNDRRSERNLCNCLKKPEKKIRTSTGFEAVTSRLPVRCSTNWAMKQLTLGAGQLWVHMFPWKKWVLMIYEINHIWTAEMKWRWRNDRRSERNLKQLHV